MYQSLVEPYFRYGCPVRGDTGINTINKLHKLQNSAASIVKNSAYDISALLVIRKLDWLMINCNVSTLDVHPRCLSIIIASVL